MDAYRSVALHCPGCNGAMETRETGHAEVDVCTTCFGLWVDEYDGELVEIAHEVASLEQGRSEIEGDGQCPRCHETLVFHGIPDVRTFVHRCVECRGTFVPRKAFDELAASAGAGAPESPMLRRVRGSRGDTR